MKMEQDTEAEIIEEEIVEEPEVVELPPNMEQITVRLDELREEVAQITQVLTSNQRELDTRVAAFNWYSQQLEAITSEKQ
tara:strand:- start:126 stop:365 length:240 start_codon:yes stop_codon:yes gene_type:complete